MTEHFGAVLSVALNPCIQKCTRPISSLQAGHKSCHPTSVSCKVSSAPINRDQKAGVWCTRRQSAEQCALAATEWSCIRPAHGQTDRSMQSASKWCDVLTALTVDKTSCFCRLELSQAPANSCSHNHSPNGTPGQLVVRLCNACRSG